MTERPVPDRRSHDPLRVCLVSGDYSANEAAGAGGGIETYVRVMSRGLAAAGHDVHVVTPAAGEPRSFTECGVEVHTVRSTDEWNGQAVELGGARDALSFAWHARRAVRHLTATTGRFDVVEAPEYKGQGVFLARDRDIPLVVKCHAHIGLCLELNGITLCPGTALLVDLERETLQNARAIHVNSWALAHRCADDHELPLDSFTRIPYGIDTDVFRPTPNRRWNSLGGTHTPVVLFVGRMEERKGIATLVRAFAAVIREVPDTVLVMVGPDVDGPPGHGSNVAWMSEQLAAAGVPANQYRYLGTIANEQLPGLYSAADVMAAPSPFEAFGLVYVEAMACGCPPVGSTTGGGAEVILDGETGLLVPPGDPEALARSLVSLLTDPETRGTMATRGQERVAHEYTVDMAVARTAAFYEKVAA